MPIQILTVPVLKDNLSYILHLTGSRQAIVIDPSEAEPVIDRLEREGLDLKLILNTHHHHDHVGGNLALAKKYNAPIWCSRIDLQRVPGASRGLEDNETFSFEGIDFHALLIPGHTHGQMAYYIPSAKAVFVGDTVFAMGCGRLFEGSAEELWSSLVRLSQLPSDTRLYFGHEYTLRNAAFTLSVDPENPAILKRLEKTKLHLSKGHIAPAPTLFEEMAVNPFFQPRRAAQSLGLTEATDLELFTELRHRRDQF